MIMIVKLKKKSDNSRTFYYLEIKKGNYSITIFVVPEPLSALMVTK